MMLKIGHRGAKGYVAENTLASIKRAMDLGVDAIEIDVHLCASGELVVFHDFTLDRMTNGSGEVAKTELNELRKLKVHGGFQIPTLVEVLELINRKCILNIELKGNHTATETHKLLMHYIENKEWKADLFLISSFNFDELKTFHEISKNFKLGVLTETNIDEALTFANFLQAYAINPHFLMLNKDVMTLLHNQGFKVFTWTVNDLETVTLMKRLGVDGIISDVPDIL